MSDDKTVYRLLPAGSVTALPIGPSIIAVLLLDRLRFLPYVEFVSGIVAVFFFVWWVGAFVNIRRAQNLDVPEEFKALRKEVARLRGEVFKLNLEGKA